MSIRGGSGAHSFQSEEIMLNDLEASTPGAAGLQTAEGHPNYDKIELRAYQTYLKCGGAPGQDVEDWLQAERERLEECKKIGRTTKATAA